MPTNDAAERWTSAIEALHEGNVVLPVQYFDQRATRLRPEMRLMLAVLEDAVGTLVRYRRSRLKRHRRAFREVWEWIRSDDAISPFAFVRICDSVGLNVGDVRRGLARIAATPAPAPLISFRRTAGARHAIGSR